MSDTKLLNKPQAVDKLKVVKIQPVKAGSLAQKELYETSILKPKKLTKSRSLPAIFDED